MATATQSVQDRANAIPPGFSENPTAWPRRRRLILLASIGLIVASYLTLYQVHVFSTVFDPIFPDGSPQVLDLTSPVPDAGFGVVAYALEIVLSLIGPEDRWRTRPWITLAFGALVTGGAVVSVALILTQAIIVGAWCTLCLVSAGLSFALFALGIPEGIAALQELRRRG